MNSSGKIGVFPIYCIIMLAVGLMNHVMVLPPLLHAAMRDAWISVTATIAPYLVWIAMLRFVMKRTQQQPILTWVRERYGWASALPLRLFFFVYLLAMGAVTLKETITWMHGSYLPRTPEIVLSISLILICFFAARSGLRAIAYVAGILLPFVIVFGDFVMSANLPRKQYALLTPMLERGFSPILEGSLYVGGGLAELIVLVLVQQRMKSEAKYWSLSLLGLFLILLVMGPVTGAIAEFGPFEAAKLRYPAYEEWRLVQLGRYIQHVDFLSIYQWMSGAFVRLSIVLLLATELLPGDSTGRRQLIWLSALCVGLVAAAALPFSDVQFLDFLRHIYLPGSLATATAALCVLFVMAALPQRGRGREKTHG